MVAMLTEPSVACTHAHGRQSGQCLELSRSRLAHYTILTVSCSQAIAVQKLLEEMW